MCRTASNCTGRRAGAQGPATRRLLSPSVMSTRRLIIAALLCGIAILLAFTAQLVLATR